MGNGLISPKPMQLVAVFSRRINCSPTGWPSLERPIGQLIAGFPVKLSRLTDRPCGYLKRAGTIWTKNMDNFNS